MAGSELRMRLPISVKDLVLIAARYAQERRVPTASVRVHTEGDEAVFTCESGVRSYHCHPCAVSWRSESSSCWLCGREGVT